MLGSRPVNFVARTWTGLWLAVVLLGPAPVWAEEEGETPAARTERARTEENSAQQRLASKRAAAAAAKANKKPAAESDEVAMRARQKVELEAFKDEPPAPKAPDWEARLGGMLAAVGIGGLLAGLGVASPALQLVSSLLLLSVLMLATKLLLNHAHRLKPRGKPVYVEEHHTMIMDDEGALEKQKTLQKAPNTRSMQTSARKEPSMQAPAASAGVRSSTAQTAPNTSFTPGNSQQMAARAEKAVQSPAERAQAAAAAAGAAAKAAMGGGTDAEDYGTIPPNFNVAGFVRKARLYFIRLQIAWDKSDIQNISEITTPEICEEFRRQIIARGPSENCTDVVAFEAEVLGVKAVGSKFVVTVKLTGIIKESMENAQEAFEEVWRMTRSVAGKENWLLADIKQY